MGRSKWLLILLLPLLFGFDTRNPFRTRGPFKASDFTIGAGSYTYYSQDTGTNHLYLNSSEIGCTRSTTTDPDVVFCDDFGDGSWYECNCDERSSALSVDGWCGTIYSGTTSGSCSQGPSIVNAIRSGGVGVGGVTYAGDTDAFACGFSGSGCDENMGDHNFGPSQTSYNELWVRFYWKFSPNFDLTGNTKLLTFNTTPAGFAGLSIGNLGTGAGDNLAFCPVQDCNTLGYQNPQGANSQGYLLHNVSAYDFDAHGGNWTKVEVHIKLESTAGTTQDGVWELWADDCGADGTACPATPTLRASYTNVRFRLTGNNDLIESIWFESNTGGVNQTKSSGDYLLSNFIRVEINRTEPIGAVDLDN